MVGLDPEEFAFRIDPVRAEGYVQSLLDLFCVLDLAGYSMVNGTGTPVV